MFNGLEIRNFKSHEHSVVPLKRLTVLLGPNNAGKSSIIQVLLLLKQSMENRSGDDELVTVGTSVNLGTARDFVTQQKRGVRIVPLSFSVLGNWMAERGDPRTNRIDFDFRCDLNTNRILLTSSSVRRDDQLILSVRRSGRSWTEESDVLNLAGTVGSIRSLIPVAQPGDAAPEPTDVRAWLSAMNDSLGTFHTWTNAFARIWHTEPLRQLIPRIAQSGKLITNELGFGGERLLLELNRPSARTRSRLITAVNRWMTDHHMLVENLRLKALDNNKNFFTLVADDPMGGKSINIADMGMGIAQALPIVAQVISNQETCGLIEQPELHLHPAAQAEMADLFVSHVYANKANQLVVETHSEHILLRLRRRIAEGALKARDVAILFVTKEDGISKVQQVDIDDDAAFQQWPVGFFEEGYSDSLAISRAIAKRRKSS